MMTCQRWSSWSPDDCARGPPPVDHRLSPRLPERVQARELRDNESSIAPTRPSSRADSPGVLPLGCHLRQCSGPHGIGNLQALTPEIVGRGTPAQHTVRSDGWPAYGHSPVRVGRRGRRPRTKRPDAPGGQRIRLRLRLRGQSSILDPASGRVGATARLRRRCARPARGPPGCPG